MKRANTGIAQILELADNVFKSATIEVFQQACLKQIKT
jgi:hypothetical protein